MTVGSRNSSYAVRRAGVLAVLVLLLGIGGAGIAHADDSPTDTSSTTSTSATSSTAESSQPSASPKAPRSSRAQDDDSARGVRTVTARDRDEAPSERRVRPRTATRPDATALLERAAARAEIPDFEPQAAAEPVAPAPTDQVTTPYGEVGKWMLGWGNKIANWGGEKYQGRTLLEAVNVIIVDPNSTTRTQAGQRLNQAMFESGFPARPLHSFGFRGRIDDVTYGQRPGPLLSYSDDFFLRQNDHGRIFGPDPVETDTGFVWSAAFSTEKVGFTGWLPGHVYVSSNRARDSLATALVNSGQATFGGLIPLENAYNTATTTTGDHDGFAVVLVLTGIGGPPRREMLV
uniref:hypothetical protein n=1 Tax=Mycolicibacterium bacteremicum TaxID=564198 RepID=UPI0026E9283F